MADISVSDPQLDVQLERDRALKLVEETQAANLKTLEYEVEALKSQLARTKESLESAEIKLRKLERLDKALSLISTWAEVQGDQFLIDLLDLID